MFEQAAMAEEQALDALESDKPRTSGATAISAAPLWYKAGKLENAAHLAHRALAKPGLLAFALQDLRELLQTIWSEQARYHAGAALPPAGLLS